MLLSCVRCLHGKKCFVTATKLGTTNIFFVAATKNFAAATKRFVDRTKHFVVVTKYLCYPYFNQWFCWYNKTFYTVLKLVVFPKIPKFAFTLGWTFLSIWNFPTVISFEKMERRNETCLLLVFDFIMEMKKITIFVLKRKIVVLWDLLRLHSEKRKCSYASCCSVGNAVTAGFVVFGPGSISYRH